MSATVRPFETSDFDALTALYPPEWRFAGATPEEEAIQERMDCAYLLACCNLRLVAEVTGPDSANPQVAGLLFARTAALPALPAEEVDHWQSLADVGHAQLAAIGSAASQRILAYIEQLEQRAALLEENAGDARGADNELELFVVGPAARGHGAGSALVATFEETLRAAGQASYWLQTDTRCTWQWYERHGFTRVGDVALTPDYPMPDAPACMQLEAFDVPHVFMYRKNLA